MTKSANDNMMTKSH